METLTSQVLQAESVRVPYLLSRSIFAAIIPLHRRAVARPSQGPLKGPRTAGHYVDHDMRKRPQDLREPRAAVLRRSQPTAAGGRTADANRPGVPVNSVSAITRLREQSQSRTTRRLGLLLQRNLLCRCQGLPKMNGCGPFGKKPVGPARAETTATRG